MEGITSKTSADFEPTLSPRFVAYVRDYLLDRGVDPDPVCQQCGIEIRQGEEYDTPLPVARIAALLEAAAEATDNPAMGMSMGQAYHYEASSLLILAMLAAPSVKEGIRCLHRYDRFVDTGIETSFNFDGPQAEFGARLLVADHVPVAQLNEYLMSFIAQILFTATRKPVPFSEVWFYHRNDQNRARLEQIFKVPVKYGQETNKLFFDREYLQERFFSSNQLLYEILVNAMKTYFVSINRDNGFLDVVCREIIRCGSSESPGTERIAKQLAMSPRTLRRKLAEEGHNFQSAKNLARETRARYFLSRTNLPLSEIAFELGFSELSAFSRAFRNWVGETPQQFRDNYKQMLSA